MIEYLSEWIIPHSQKKEEYCTNHMSEEKHETQFNNELMDNAATEPNN